MLLRLGPFKGIAPRIDSTMLAENAATVAENVTLKSGALRPLAALGDAVAVLRPGINKTIYRYDGQHWLSWLDVVHVVESPIPGDTHKRLYWTGDGPPKMGDQSTILQGGGGMYPVNSYNLGIPAPASPAWVTASGTATSDDPAEADSRVYVYTYVSAWGEEGPPSAPSARVDVYPGQSVDLSGMSAAPSGSYNITHKRIYRTNTGTNTTEYQYVASVLVANTTYSDSIAKDDLGELLPSVDWDPPPTDLKGLIALPCGSLCGYRDNELYFSVPYMPHAWPATFILSFADKVQGIGAYGSSILVATDGSPYVVTGQTPGSMGLERLEAGHGCIASRGLVDMGYTVVYPATDGLMAVGVGGVNLATNELMGIKEWSEMFDQASIWCIHYDNQYIAFTSKGNYIFDPRSGDLTTFTGITGVSGFNDPATGELFICTGNHVCKWEDDEPLTLTWKSKLFTLPWASNFGAAQVFADAYPLTFKVYADGVLKHTQSVTSSEPFRLPAGFRAIKWQVEVSGTKAITAALMASTITELAQV